MQTLLEVLSVLAFVVAIVIGPIAWFRIIRARTRAAYWRSIALFVGPILLALLLAQAAGLMPEVATPAAPPPSVDAVLDGMSTHQIVLLALAGLVWVGGGNLLFHLHRRRLGKKWWQMLNPLEPPFKDFNAREWWTLATLAITTFTLGIVAMPA